MQNTHLFKNQKNITGVQASAMDLIHVWLAWLEEEQRVQI